MKIWTCGSGSRNAWARIKNVNSASRLSNFWNFFDAIQIISCRDWWPWMKHRYVTMTRRQSNNEWNGGIAAHLAQKNSECKNPLEKISPRLIFWDQYGILFIDYLQRGKLSTRSITHLCWYNWRTFWRKNAAGFFLHDNPSAHRALGTQKKLAAWASSVFITHPILRILPHQTTTCSLDWKNHWKFAIFRPTQRSLLPQRPGWTDNLLNFFWVACKSYSKGLRSVLSFVGSMLNKSWVWSL